VKKAVHRIFYAASLDDAHDEASKFLARYGEEFPTATKVLGKHRSLCLTFYHFPERHWRHIRTSNVLERAFKKVRRRTSVVGRFPGETSALMMVFGVLEEERLKWQRVMMRAQDIAWIEEAVKSLDSQPIRIEPFERVPVN
jgi:transposase-like protein